MEQIERVPVHDPGEIRGGSIEEGLKAYMSFLAENPEAFGMISGACPLVTGSLLIAANGFEAREDRGAPVLEMPPEGTGGLMNGLFTDLVEGSDENLTALRMAFGQNKITPENTVPRFCAALAEVTALQILEGPAKGASVEQTCLLLQTALNRNISAFRERLASDQSTEELDPVFFSVSLGLCRFFGTEPDTYAIDLFSAGNFRLYLLDEQGMAPLWEEATPVDIPLRLKAERKIIHHPGPFALILLSEGVFSLNAVETRSLHESPGMLWRYRMRLEEHFVRLISDCVHDFELSERATKFFTGRARGRSDASGAVAFLTEGSSYEIFRSHCHARLGELEKLTALLPDGYDSRRRPITGERTQIEQSYLHRLLDRSVGLSVRVSDAIRFTVTEMLRRQGPLSTEAPPEGVPDYQRLEWEFLHRTFRKYDCENDGDRERILENRRMLREMLSEHWITLRPALLSYYRRVGEAPYTDPGLRSYDACLDMNSRLADMLVLRQNTVDSLENALLDSLDILQSGGNDWVCGRTGVEGTRAFTNGLTKSLPSLLAYLQNGWEEDTLRYRCLHAAYTAERERLFRLDTRSGEGFFASDWQAIHDGCMKDGRWAELRACLMEIPETAVYAELWDSLDRISHGTAALLARIRARAAESRTARDLADRPGLWVDALRGAAYEDPAWGESVISVMDTATRNDFRASIRRWQESCELNRCQAEAFELYSTMYGRYL
ncbi:MAG: hypothetical protein IJD38_01930 [Clostridia bacterium]|nr:hypothetical protein [Clostridia bacterium]